ncbi:MAG TPA: EAL domain-containing protein [Burkholderiales bacterium]|jgi:diguanylate cyclase (GGDEF)-like protein|nr:EAL domain-containing protein [Burkholderiales bacterium]
MRLGLSAKFTVTVLVILICTMAANTLYFLGTSTRLHEQQLLERGRALGRLVSLISPEAILGFDFLLLNDYTREVSSQPDVAYGAILTPQGVPISYHVDTNDPYVRKRAREGGSVEITELIKKPEGVEDLIRLDYPITHNNVLLGHFLVGISRESLQSQLRRQVVIQAVVMGAIVLFLSAAIYGAFRFNVLFPIRRLIAASREVGRGRFTAVEVRTADELGQLAQSFNAMAQEVKEEQAKLHRQANFDALTGLPNRMMAFDRINLEIHRARRTGQRFAVLFIDLDNFKSVNDTLGHAFGDELLAAIGAKLQESLREADTVARLGGDEFLILVPEVVSEVEIERIAERLLQSVSEARDLNGRKVVIHCSVGIAIYPDNGESVETLMANADNAMYQAKAAQEGSAIFFTEEMNIRLRERMQMEQDLNGAIELGQLALHFQPIVDTAGPRHRGAEALLRWHHPERGQVSPADFIPLAETTGQIVGIGDWVLEQACRCWRTWHDAGVNPGFLAINVSRIQFRKRFSKRLAELMAAYRIPAHALEFEITESVLLDDHHQVAEELGSLRALGVKLALDDFGTGYSSLSYLKRFRFDVLKIDRSFVAGLPTNPDDVSLVKAILAMAKGLDLRVLAEGVEHHAQLEFLAAQGCDFAQGYLIARPMSEDAYRAYLTNRQANGDASNLAVIHQMRAAKGRGQL